MGNRFATFVTSMLAGQSISDAQSGFRAIHRELALRLVVEAKKTYVQETLIRPIRMGYKVVEIPIKFRKRNDESRLISGIWSYAFNVFPDLMLTYAQVAPLRFFGGIAAILLMIALPFLLVISIFSLYGSLPIIFGMMQILLPVIVVLIGLGALMDHQEKIRRWHSEMNALSED